MPNPLDLFYVYAMLYAPHILGAYCAVVLTLIFIRLGKTAPHPPKVYRP